MIKFGTGGFRAIIGEDFTKESIQLVASALANIMNTNNYKKDLVIGYDRRFLSDVGSKWFAEVMAGNGIKVYYIDKIAPTPLIMYTVKRMEIDFGVAITASHNSALYNGIKIFTKGGKDANLEFTRLVETEILKIKEVKVSQFEKEVKSKNIKIIDPFNDYIDGILRMIDIDLIKEKRLRILLDPMHGVSGNALRTLLLTTRCDVDTINDSHDALFGGRLPSPSKDTLLHLSNEVVEKGYDLGIATDGDADRIGIVDRYGNYIHPNKLLSLLYYYLLEYKGIKGDVVRNIATTHLLDSIAKDYKQLCHQVNVGFKYISSKMDETNAIIGGESSGGLTIKGHIFGKDGIFAAMVIIEMICNTNKSIDQLIEELDNKYGTYSMIEGNYEYNDSDKEKIYDTLYNQKLLPDFNQKIKSVNFQDGIKVEFEAGGWIIVRFSGTEPILRIFCEKENDKETRKTLTFFKKFIEDVCK